MSWCYLRKLGPWLSGAIVMLLVLEPSATFASPNLQRQETQTPAVRIADIALQQGGILRGQVVDSAGIGIADAKMELANGQQRWQTKTDAKGLFRIVDLRGGVYELQTAGQSQVLRAWTVGTAPPSVSCGVLFAPETDVIRGQRVVSPNTNQFFRVAKQRLANPWIIGGITATAVAIPVAIHNADDDDPPATP